MKGSATEVPAGGRGERNAGEHAFDPRAEVASTGIAGLDVIMRGGFPRDFLHLVQGSPGTGKTTLGLQFLLEGRAAGEPVIYVSFTETEPELVSVARSHGWSLEDIHVHIASPMAGALEPETHYTLFQPMEVELGEAIQRLLEQVDRVQPRRVVFDPISSLRIMARDALGYRRQLMAIREFFTERECTVLLIDDSAGGGDFQIQTRAHSVIDLRQSPQSFGPDRRQLRVVKLRGVDFEGGFHDFEIVTGGLVVHPRLTGSAAPEPLESPAVSGIDGLDQLLGGGLDRGTATLFMGPPGAGKSTLASVYIDAAARRGEHAAVFTFDETEASYFGRMESLGVPLRGLFEDGRLTFRRVEPAEWSPGRFAREVRDEVVEAGARAVLVDSLNGYLRAMPDPEALLLQLRELLSFLGRSDVLTLMTVSHQGVVGDRLDARMETTYMADTVVLLRYFEAQGEVRQAVSVTKKRSGGHERTLRELRMSSEGIRIGPPLTDFEGVLTGVPIFTGQSASLLGVEDE